MWSSVQPVVRKNVAINKSFVIIEEERSGVLPCTAEEWYFLEYIQNPFEGLFVRPSGSNFLRERTGRLFYFLPLLHQ
jgi:hypothetical protein